MALPFLSHSNRNWQTTGEDNDRSGYKQTMEEDRRTRDALSAMVSTKVCVCLLCLPICPVCLSALSACVGSFP